MKRELDQVSSTKEQPCAKKVHVGGDGRTYFRVFRVNEGDVRGEDYKSRFTVQMFAKNEIGESFAVSVATNPYFCLEVDDSFDSKKIERFRSHLAGLMDREGKDLVDIKRDDGKRYFGFTAEKTFPFIRLSFRNHRAFNKAKWRLPVQSPMVFEGTKMIPNDSFLNPMFRFFHQTKTGFPEGWFSIDTRLFQRTIESSVNKESVTTCKYELTIPFAALRAEPDKTDEVPVKCNAYDIEVDSELGAFPEPIKTYRALSSALVGIFERDKKHKKTDLSGPAARLAGTTRFRKCVRNAFLGLAAARAAGVEPVFPKQPVAITDIDKYIELVLNTDTKLDSLAPNKTIDEIFNAVHYFAKEDKEDKGGEGAGDEDRVEKRESAPTLLRGQTVLDILFSDIHKHDAKVETIDRILTSIFPPLRGDPVRMIGNSWCYYGSSEYHSVLFVVGSCAVIQNAEIRSFEKESEMLLAWSKWYVDELDADYELGWNNTSFDDMYMFLRAKELGIEEEFLKLSRIKEHVCARTLGQDYRAYKERLEKVKANPHIVVDKAELIIHTSQCKEFSLSYIQAPGRQKVDAMMYYVRAGKRLTSFKLDDVASTIITDKISGITEEGFNDERTLLLTKNMKGLNAGDYINLIKTGFSTEAAMEKGFKAEVMEVRADGLVVRGHIADKLAAILADPNFTLSWGLAKNDMDMKTMFRLSKESAEGRALVGRYCLRDCTLTLDVVNKQDVIREICATSRVCGVDGNTLFFDGQTKVFTSLLAKMCTEDNIHIEDLLRISYDQDDKKQKFEGATVLNPVANIYDDNPVACNDFAALYPSIIAGNNLSPDMKVWTKVFNENGELLEMEGTEENDNLPGWKYRNIEFDHFKQRKVLKAGKVSYVDERIGIKVCRFATRDDGGKSKGILPRVILHLLEGRALAKKNMKAAVDAFIVALFNEMQLAFKVRSNSAYGCQGADSSPVRDKDVAACITAIGRACIMFVKTVAERTYMGKPVTLKCGRVVNADVLVVYGDTDSVFFTFNLSDPLTGNKIRGREARIITFELAIEVARLASMFLPLPMELAFEKVIMEFVLLSKKRYFGKMYKTPENPDKCEILMSGLATKRRDSCDLVKDLYGKLLTIICTGKRVAVSQCIDFLEEQLQLLAENKVPHDKLLLTCALRSYYKDPHTIKQWVLSERIGQRDPGAKPRPGDRVPFLFIVPPPLVGKEKKRVLGDCIETPEYIKAKQLKVDTEYYITNQIMNPVMQLLGLQVENICLLKRKQGTLEKLNRTLNMIDKTYKDPSKRFKQRELACTEVVKALVFDPFLQRIKNKRERNQDLRTSSFFRAR